MINVVKETTPGLKIGSEPSKPGVETSQLVVSAEGVQGTSGIAGIASGRCGSVEGYES